VHLDGRRAEVEESDVPVEVSRAEALTDAGGCGGAGLWMWDQTNRAGED
jgi:hypothetical protein